MCTLTTGGSRQTIGRLDAAAFRFMNSGLASPALDRLMLAATIPGIGLAQTGLCLGLILLGWLMDRVNLRRAGYAGMVAFALSGIAVQVAKFIWDRPRPLLVLFDVRIVGEPLFTHSFPSGHTTTAFAVALACSTFVPRLKYALIPLALATAISRVYLGVHYPIDVAYGGLVGALIGLGSARLVYYRHRRESTGKEAAPAN